MRKPTITISKKTLAKLAGGATSKRMMVEALVKQNNNKMSTKELVSLVMGEANMSEQGARTYVYDARVRFKLGKP